MARRQFAVRLTFAAKGDLDAIGDYLAEQVSVEAANVFIEAVLDKIATLEQFPMRGSIPAEMERLGLGEFRQLLLWPYRLIYRVEEKTVFIVAVADGRRNMQSFLEKRLLDR